MAHMVKNESYNMYKNTTMNMDVLNMLLENDILKSIMRSMFQLTNIELANVEHCTNITNLHQFFKNDETKHYKNMSHRNI